MSDHAVTVQVALGNDPRPEHGGGRFSDAANFLYRLYENEDAVATQVHSQKDRQRLKKSQSDAIVIWPKSATRQKSTPSTGTIRQMSGTSAG